MHMRYHKGVWRDGWDPMLNNMHDVSGSSLEMEKPPVRSTSTVQIRISWPVVLIGIIINQ